MESSSVWYNIYRYLSEEKHLNVVLSNPIKTRAIASAKIKTDKLDAAKLANLLRGGYITECYVPDRRIMDLRELVRHRAALVRMRTKLKNKIHSIVLMKGIKISSKHCSFTQVLLVLLVQCLLQCSLWSCCKSQKYSSTATIPKSILSS